MDWDNVRVFLAVARAGQFLAAARLLRVDHATATRRVTRLEQALGTRLFERRTSGCVLTQAGERFLAAAEKIEGDMLRVQTELSAQDVEVSGTVRIGAPDGFGTLFLAPRLAKLARRHPALMIQLVPLPRTFSLSNREADLAIVIDRPEAGRLVSRKLVDYTLHFYAAKSYVAAQGAPQDFAELSQHLQVTYVPDLLFSEALNFIPQVFGPGFRRFECASALAQVEAVRAGAGLGILHDYASRVDPDLQVVLADVLFERTYWIATHADTHDLMRVRVVSDFIISEVTADRHIFAYKA
ncbi:MAG: LysR family transcriptional regulator [Beijerinckiaceae bacterium]